VVNIELGNCHDGVSAIEGGFEALAGLGIIGGDKVAMQIVEERVEMNHVPRHVVGPFEHLGSNVDQECIRGPTSEDHNFCWGVVHQKKQHSRARFDGSVSDLVWVKAKQFESPEQEAGVLEQFPDKGVN
jgi:hypothetical protein